MLELFSTLSSLASATERIRLGTAVCLVPQRNPVYTAKSVSTVDWLSGGRFDFGIGIGWLREEFATLDAPFERRARTHARVPRGDAHALARRGVVVRRRPLHPPAVPNVPEAIPGRRATDLLRR